MLGGADNPNGELPSYITGADKNQRQESWLMVHVRAFEFFGGVPQLLIPDNLKAAVSRADRYEPVLNENYRKLARHYNTAVIPAPQAKRQTQS